MNTIVRAHRRSYDNPGDSHFLTFSCFQRRPLFTPDRTYGWMTDALRKGRLVGQYRLWAYVIMPEHVHVVLQPLDTSVADVLRSMKKSVTNREISWRTINAPDSLDLMLDSQPNGKTTHRFWQRGGGYDRNIRSILDLHEKIAYVHANPVRRGLVSNMMNWRWSSARAWETGIDDPIEIDRESFPTLS